LIKETNKNSTILSYQQFDGVTSLYIFELKWRHPIRSASVQWHCPTKLVKWTNSLNTIIFLLA
jgi:hypothetical protein